MSASSAGRQNHPYHPWMATVLSLYPEMFPGPLGGSLAGKALENGLWQLVSVDIRDFASDKHATVDDAPMGGGAGMVMRPDVVDAAIKNTQENQAAKTPLIYLSPRGKPLTQARVREFAQGPGITLLCGRFEGVDERVLERHGVEEVSIGDFVLSGGEVAAMVLLDAVIRLLPGVMGSKKSLEEESFETGLLEYPHYTRPREWEGMKVPEVLLSGHHEKISDWRVEQAKETTRKRRPDLWQAYESKRSDKND